MALSEISIIVGYRLDEPLIVKLRLLSTAAPTAPPILEITLELVARFTVKLLVRLVIVTVPLALATTPAFKLVVA